MQSKENYQHVLVSKTLFKRLVHQHAACSGCGHTVDTHGGQMPCHGAYAIINMEIINAVATKTSEPDRRPEYHFITNDLHHTDRPGIDYEIRTIASPISPDEASRIRLWE